MLDFIDCALIYVIKYLKNSKCQIPQDYFRHMEYIAKHKIVIYITNNDLKTQVVLKDSFGRPLGTITVYNVSQVVDIPPYGSNDLQKCSPYFIVGKMQPSIISWTILHEAIHLLSIGPYVPYKDNTWNHHYGINHYVYPILSNCNKVKKSVHNGINELITDLITWELIGNCEKDCFVYKGLRYFKAYVNKHFTKEINLMTLMTWYFTGDARIKNFLLGSYYKNYEDLYEDLQSHY